MTLEPNADAADFAVANHPEAQRYEIVVDTQVAGFAEYVILPAAHGRTVPATIVFTHTVILDEFEGQGLGSKLAKAALDDARAHDMSVTPQCPFFARYIERHTEYADLLGTG